jgi:hypothetical protein
VLPPPQNPPLSRQAAAHHPHAHAPDDP